MAGPIDVFISYAQADEALRGELEAHLARLQRGGVIRAFDRAKIAAGVSRRETIEAHLRAAPLVVLLVSSDYFSSDDLHETDLRIAIARARASEASVIPIVVRACDWEPEIFADLQVLPGNRVPVTSWPNRDEAWKAVVVGIREAIEGIGGGGPAPEPAYESAEVQALAEQLARARSRRRALEVSGDGTDVVDKEILDLRRSLREGGHLRVGDALGDGRYLLLKELGHGGFATVWKARDREGNGLVAVKVLHPSLSREASRRERFFRGARVMASLAHAAVVRVLEPHGEDGGYLYFVMELVEGLDLQRAVLAKQVVGERVVPLVLSVGEALAEAHRAGIVHRDVKPANILLDEKGRARLTDFDLVAAKDTTGGTRTGAMGTFLFMAPEQIESAKEADARADVYGLGMTAVYCLHGRELPSIAVRQPDRVIAALACAEAVKAVLIRAIEVEPEARYADAGVFCEALRVAWVSPPVLPAPPWERAVPPPPPPAFEPPSLRAPPARVGYDVPTLQPPMPEEPPHQARYAVELARRDEEKADAEAAVSPGAAPASRWTIAAAVAAVAGAAGGLAAGLLSGGRPPRQETPDAGPTATASAVMSALPINSHLDAGNAGGCPEGMVLIPGDTFVMGSNDEESGERPAHKVKLSSFCMDKTEVTVSAYRACTQEKHGSNQCTAPGSLGFCNWEKLDRDDHPINCVDWEQARTYCAWTGGALPTEAQWEYAARGTDGRKYPWAPPALPSNQLCWNGDGNDLGRGNRRSTCAVGRYAAGASPFGLLDMAGNVWEWTADWYAPYVSDGSTIPLDPRGPDKAPGEASRAIRGGHWGDDNASWVRVVLRDRHAVSIRSSHVGFRCSRGPN